MAKYARPNLFCHYILSSDIHLCVLLHAGSGARKHIAVYWTTIVCRLQGYGRNLFCLLVYLVARLGRHRHLRVPDVLVFLLGISM